jgi:hypothetical protein
LTVANVLQEVERGAKPDPAVGLRRIDCDVHPIFDQAWTTELSPYMSKEWGMRLLGGGTITKSDGQERNLASFSRGPDGGRQGPVHELGRLRRVPARRL